MQPRWRLVILGLLALLVHARTVANGFVFDDLPAIVANPLLRGPLSLGTLVTHDFWGAAAVDTQIGTWRPLVVLTFVVDWRLGGGAPWLFHLHNLVWHALACGALAFALRRRWPAAPWAEATLLFATLAASTEAVASVVGRADLMAAAFSFLALGLVGAGWRSHLAAAAALFAAQLCKESAALVPVCLVALDLLGVLDPAAQAPRWRDRLPAYLGFAATVIVYLVLRTTLFAPPSQVIVAPMNNPLVGEPWWVRGLTALGLLVLTLRLIALPINLSPDYSFAELLPERTLASPTVWAGVLLVVLLGLAAARTRRSRPAIAAGIVMFAVPWLTISNLVVLLPTIFAERLLYAPAAGLALVTATVLGERGRLGRAALALLVVGNLALAMRTDAAWHDEESLFRMAVEVSPRAARAWLNYGAALMRRGQRERAVAAFEQARSIAPDWSRPHALLGAAFDQAGRADLALPALRRAVALEPDTPDGVYNLVTFLARHERRQEAIEVLSGFVARHPRDAAAARMLRGLSGDSPR